MRAVSSIRLAFCMLALAAVNCTPSAPATMQGAAGNPGSGNGTGAAGTGGTASAGSSGAAAGSSGTGGGGNGGAAGSGGQAGHVGAAGAAGGRGGAAGAAGGRGGGSAGHGGGTAGHGAVDAGADAVSLPGTNNPVLPGLNADPQVAEFDGVFYIYPTTDGYANWGATSFSVFSSTNLVDWADRGVILDLAKDLTWATQSAWAPGIARSGSTYYLYFCAAQQIGVATSASPTGPFKDALGHPLITTRQYGPQSIDPYPFIDDDGTRYLYFGSGTGGLRVAKLGADMTSLAGTPIDISPSGASGVLEGSAMLKRKGVYYLQWSEGDTRNASYQVAYARASSPTGPFTRQATILQQDTTQGILATGGSTVLGFPARDEFYIVYHRFKIPGGDGTHREVCIDRLFFNSDGTIAPVKPTLQGLQAAVSP
jgi:Glycosyl hydrolases family 43